MPPRVSSSRSLRYFEVLKLLQSCSEFGDPDLERLVVKLFRLKWLLSVPDQASALPRQGVIQALQGAVILLVLVIVTVRVMVITCSISSSTKRSTKQT